MEAYHLKIANLGFRTSDSSIDLNGVISITIKGNSSDGKISIDGNRVDDPYQAKKDKNKKIDLLTGNGLIKLEFRDYGKKRIEAKEIFS